MRIVMTREEAIAAVGIDAVKKVEAENCEPTGETMCGALDTLEGL